MRNLHRCHCLPKFSKYEKNNKNIPTGVQWTTPTPRTPPSVSKWLKLVDRSSSERYSALLPKFESTFYCLRFYILFHARAIFELNNVLANTLGFRISHCSWKNLLKWSINGLKLLARLFLFAVELSEKWRFCKISLNLDLVPMSPLAWFPIKSSFDQKCYIVDNLLILIILFLEILLTLTH